MISSQQQHKTLGKGAAIELAKIIFTSITGHYITDFVFEDNTQKLIEQNKNILHNRELILLNQPANTKELDLTQEKIKLTIKNMQDLSKDIEIEYYDFIDRERENLKYRLKNQLEKTPLNVENVYRIAKL